MNNEIRQGRFREDLYYRLSELSIVIPPLRERREDIPDLSVHFLSEINSVYGRGNDLPVLPVCVANATGRRQTGIPLLNKKAIDFLLGYEFKGNVRELRSILLRAYFLKKGREINRDDLITAIGIESTHLTGGKVFSSEDTVSGIYESIVSDDKDFWSAIYEPFINREISRETVKLVLNKARLNGDDSLPKLAVRLKACKEDFNKLPAGKKKFISFRNFLYKTVKITA